MRSIVCSLVRVQGLTLSASPAEKRLVRTDIVIFTKKRIEDFLIEIKSVVDTVDARSLLSYRTAHALVSYCREDDYTYSDRSD